MANETQVINKALQGDRDAFCCIYDLYKDRLYRYAFYRLRNREEAEDAVSDCVLSAWKQIRSLREPEAFPAWIFRILSGSCSKIIKKQIDDREKASELWRDETRKREGSLSAGCPDQALVLQEALRLLSEEERNIVLLSVIAGLKSGEIADITGLTAGSVRSSLSRSLHKMRGYLE
ncbi:MAG: sigma-70 family RNA polymerase sigma factor [Bacillota bacterium]|nr:sigma-70 family RNA polymerase sigma factor [Bacillota bacterium]